MALPVQENIHNTGWKLWKNSFKAGIQVYAGSFALGTMLGRLSPTAAQIGGVVMGTVTVLQFGYRKQQMVQQIARKDFPQSSWLQPLTNPTALTTIQAVHGVLVGLAMTFPAIGGSDSGEEMLRLSSMVTVAAHLPSVGVIVRRSLHGLRVAFSECSLKNGLIHAANAFGEVIMVPVTLLTPAGIRAMHSDVQGPVVGSLFQQAAKNMNKELGYSE